MHLVGITGSIAMGKSTVADMFAKAGIPVWNADRAVASLYQPDGTGTLALRDLLPSSMMTDAGVNRAALRQAIATDRTLLKSVERVIHPLVRNHRQVFLEQCRSDNQTLAVLEVPLLFENGIEDEVDTVIVVTAPADVQKERVLSERNLDIGEFQSLLENQMPDREKRQKADHVIVSIDFDDTRKQVQMLLKTLRSQHPCAN